MMPRTELPTATYLGEPAPRRPGLAFLLTLLCPGLGSAYLGRPFKGALISLAFSVAAACFVVLWTRLKFFPALPLLVFGVGWLLFGWLLARESARSARRTGDGYVLRAGNSAVAYVFIAIAMYLLPLGALVQYTQTRLWSLVTVEGDAMYPTLLDGDMLLIDRTAYWAEDPKAGEVVVVEMGVDGRDWLVPARVVGVPGDQVAVDNSVPWVNGDPLPRTHVTAETGAGGTVLAGLLEEGAGLDNRQTFAEVNRGAGYLTSQNQTVVVVTVFEPVSMAEREFYVLHDNRSRSGDSRELGPIDRAHIIGRPLFVAYSSSAAGDVRWERVARRVQPAPQSTR